jgi:hypothetical protein
LRNAFVHALQPSIDQSINIGKVEDVEEDKSLLKKLFGKPEKEKNSEKEQEKANKKK